MADGFLNSLPGQLEERRQWFLFLEACLCGEDKYHYYLMSQEDLDSLEAQFQVPLFLPSVLGSLRKKYIKSKSVLWQHSTGKHHFLKSMIFM